MQEGLRERVLVDNLTLSPPERCCIQIGSDTTPHFCFTKGLDPPSYNSDTKQAVAMRADRLLTLCADSYSVFVPPQCYRNCTKKTPVILPNMQVAGGSTMRLSRHSMGTCQEKSSYATHEGTLSHNHLSSLSDCGLILT